MAIISPAESFTPISSTLWERSITVFRGCLSRTPSRGWTVPWELACYVLLGGLAAFGIFRRRHWLALSLAGLHIIQIGNTMFRTNEEIKVAGGATLVISFVAGLTIYRYR